ncbi:GM10316 [Drosophila sechellia]|uniref:GM10316 n=1 Tax=Drosophila sechellia TaxID=7238 RepID=B4ICK9_DROSE|nr:GM10316 [Drosophila sechellia]
MLRSDLSRSKRFSEHKPKDIWDDKDGRKFVRDQMELLRVAPIDQSIPAEDIMGRSYCRYQGPRT